MATLTKRSSALKIMLHPDMHDKLRALAQHLGQAPSALASLAVSQYVAQQTAALGASERAVTGLIDSLAPDLKLMMEKMAEAAPDQPAPPARRRAAKQPRLEGMK
jgi:hypothetical protein